jgi:hypothetical protein
MWLLRSRLPTRPRSMSHDVLFDYDEKRTMRGQQGEALHRARALTEASASLFEHAGARGVAVCYSIRLHPARRG